ncbi:MAG TPA: hypothetical protein VGB77_04875 [Abditibacteriaceae bacterium]|jgi:hypothetical protein
MRVLDPLAPDYWIRAVLLDTAGKTCVINGQTMSADAVAFCGERIYPAREGFQPPAWPYILFGPARDAVFDNYAQEAVLMDGEYLIRAMMREDEPLNGKGLEEFNQPGFRAIMNAFQGVGEIFSVDSGLIHGCSVIRPHRRMYGEPGKRISELGVIARIFSN